MDIAVIPVFVEEELEVVTVNRRRAVSHLMHTPWYRLLLGSPLWVSLVTGLRLEACSQAVWTKAYVYGDKPLF